MFINLDRSSLASLLRKAAEAHHQYEEEAKAKDPNWTDPDWPNWYANWILDRISERQQ